MKTLKQIQEEKPLFILDKKGRKIELGDILKIYHFTGARRKKYFMYKQVISEVSRFSNDKSFFLISNLALRDSSYHLEKDNSLHNEIEIVQSITKVHFEDRTKYKQ